MIGSGNSAPPAADTLEGVTVSLARLSTPAAIVGAPSRTKHPSATRMPSRTAIRPLIMARPTKATARMHKVIATVPSSVPLSHWAAAGRTGAGGAANREGDTIATPSFP